MSAPVLAPRARRAVESEIERLIGLLDAIDGDPDREEDDPPEEDDGCEDDARHREVPVFGLDQSGWPRNASLAWARGFYTDAWLPA